MCKTLSKEKQDTVNECYCCYVNDIDIIVLCKHMPKEGLRMTAKVFYAQQNITCSIILQ